MKLIAINPVTMEVEIRVTSSDGDFSIFMPHVTYLKYYGSVK